MQVNKAYGDLPLVECYAGQLNQVFMNLLSNAIDALEDSNQQRTFQDIASNPNNIWIHTEVGDRKQIKITIADNGKGIVKDVRSRLFDPFFTTKPIGRGTGLGLSISRNIIQAHSGNFYIDPECKNTRIVVELPKVQRKQPVPANEAPEARQVVDAIVSPDKKSDGSEDSALKTPARMHKKIA